jgi:hypothetical protein
MRPLDLVLEIEDHDHGTEDHNGVPQSVNSSRLMRWWVFEVGSSTKG